jgi:hypothetical protein
LPAAGLRTALAGLAAPTTAGVVVQFDTWPKFERFIREVVKGGATQGGGEPEEDH